MRYHKATPVAIVFFPKRDENKCNILCSLRIIGILGGALSKRVGKCMRFSPEWLEGYTKKKRSPQKTKSTDVSWLDKVVKVSVHAAALAALAKKPELLKGNYEHYDQVQIFDCIHRKYPSLYDLLHATPNGGYRTKKSANQMPAEGQRKGYPDMSLDLPAGIYHGMRIELKHGKRKPEVEQAKWLRALSAQGYYCILAFSPEEAVKELVAYSRLNPGETMPVHQNDHYWKEPAAA